VAKSVPVRTSPAIFAPPSERELQRDIHEVRRAVADIRQESENDKDHQRGMRVTGRMPLTGQNESAAM